MTAALQSFVDGPLGLYVVEVLVDQADPLDAAFAPWDRETLDGTFTEVDLLTKPDVSYGELDLGWGLSVLPSSLSLDLDDPTGAVADLLRQYPQRNDLLVRYRSVDVVVGSELDWFGRVVSRTRRRPTTRDTRRGRTGLDATCGLAGLKDLDGRSVKLMTTLETAADACHAANPHLPVRFFSDVYAEGQATYVGGYQSGLNLRWADELAGKAYRAENVGDAADEPEGDYGTAREQLDREADHLGLRVYQDPITGTWDALPWAAIGESLPDAERLVYGPPAVGTSHTPPGSAPIEGNTVAPLVLDDEPDYGLHEAEPVSGVRVEVGAAGLMPPQPAGENGLAVYTLLRVAADPDVRIFVGAYGTRSQDPSSSYVDVELVGDDGTTYHLDETSAGVGTWSASPALLYDDDVDDPFDPGAGVYAATFPVGGRLRVRVNEDGISYGVGVVLVDGAGAEIDTWTLTIGAEGEGETVERSAPPRMEKLLPEGGWGAAEDYLSQRWATTSGYLTEYAAEALLRVRGEASTILDGALPGLHGPGRRLLVDPDDLYAEPDALTRAPFLVGAGCQLRPGSGDTRGVWIALPDAALATPSIPPE